MFSCTVSRTEDGTPLQAFLAARRGLSRRKAKDLLDRRRIYVNQRPVWMAHHVLHAGDIVEGPDSGARLKPTHLKVLFQDDEYIVVDKPAGMLSDGEHSVESLARVQLDCPTLVAAHRLDRDTTGCLLLAGTPQARERIIEVFRANQVCKTYHAIVSGRVKADTRTLRDAIDGKSAVSRIRVLDAKPAATHLQVAIETGRTHQIRKHVASVGHSVIGDRHYRAGRKRLDPRDMKAGRQMLHAGGFAFLHPGTRRRVVVKAPLPADFRRCLKAYGLT